MKAKDMRKMLLEVPDDPYGAFAWFVSHCARGLYKELLASGKTDTEARNAVIHCFLDFASGEACRVARGEGREPDSEKWRAATDKAFERAIKRTMPDIKVGEYTADYSPLTAEELQQPTGAEELLARSKPAQR